MPTLRKTALKNQLPTPDLDVLAEESLNVTQDLGKVLQTPSRLSFPEKLKKFQNAEKCMFTAPRSKGDITSDEQPTPLSVVTSTPSVDRFGKTVSSISVAEAFLTPHLVFRVEFPDLLSDY